LPGSDMVVVSDPAAITQVLVTDAASYYKNTAVKAVSPLAEDGGDVFTQPGGTAWANSKAKNPLALALKGDWLGKALPAMQHDIQRQVDNWIGKSFEHTYGVHLHLAFDVFSKMLYGVQFSGETFKDWVALTDEIDRRIKALPPFLLDSIPEGPQEAKEHLRRTFVIAVEKARANPDKSGPDLLRHALREGCDHSDRLLANELALMYYAGIISSTSAVTSTLYMLCKSDAEKAKVSNALAALGPSPSAQAIIDCKELQAAVLETLRLLPPVSVWSRNVLPTATTELGGYTLPPNTIVMLGSRFAHTDPAHWEAPGVYRPDRWTAERRASDPLGSEHFMPFGRGERACFAQDVALAYIHLAVGTILLRTDPQVGMAQLIKQGFWFATMVPEGMKSDYSKPRG